MSFMLLQYLEATGALSALCWVLQLPSRVTHASAAASPGAPGQRQPRSVRLCPCRAFASNAMHSDAAEGHMISDGDCSC